MFSSFYAPLSVIKYSNLTENISTNYPTVYITPNVSTITTLLMKNVNILYPIHIYISTRQQEGKAINFQFSGMFYHKY